MAGRYVEIWAVSLSRLEEHFGGEGVCTGPGCYCCGGCTVRLEVLPDRKVGTLTFPQTRVEMAGEREELEPLRRRFLLRFASAGG